MTPEQWAASAVFLVVAAVSVLALRGGGLWKVQSCRFVCPLLKQPVACRIQQDVRIGRWLGVQSCSAFGDPEELSCGQECVRLMNLGIRLSAPASTPS